MCCTMQLGALASLFSLLLGPCCPQDPPVQVTLAVAPATILETTGTATITATFASASTDDLTLHLEGQQTPETDPKIYTLSSADIVVPAGQSSGTATVEAVRSSGRRGGPTGSVVFSVTKITSASCSWDVNIPAGALTIGRRGGYGPGLSAP
jgi:fibronectin-binding autotransporter adhesin